MALRGRTEPGVLRVLGLLAACAALLFAPAPAGADEPRRPDLDKKARAEARSLADKGQARYDQGDYEGAAEFFSKADAIAPVPTVEVALAKALLKLGRLADAAAAYTKASKAEVTAESPPSLIDAVGQAKKELRELLPRVPALEVSVGPGVSGVAIDGRAIPPLELAAPVLLNPGPHTITASGAPAQKVSLAPGERKRIALTPPPPREETNWRYVGGIAGIGVSAVALGVAVGSSIRTVQLGREFEPYRMVEPYSQQTDICAFAELTQGDPALTVDSQKLVSICDQSRVFTVLQLIMYPLHAVTAAGGIYLLVTSGGSAKQPAARPVFTPRVGPGLAALDMTLRF